MDNGKRKRTDRRSPQPLDEPTRAIPPPEVGRDGSSRDEIRFESEGSPLLDIRFSSARREREVDIVNAFIMSDYTRVLARRRVDDVEKVLAVYNRRVFSLVFSSILLIFTSLSVLENCILFSYLPNRF